jgi:hypothetical protein
VPFCATMSEKGVRLAQNREVNPCIPMGILSYKRLK